MLSLKTGLKDGINLHTSMFYLFASIETPFVFSYTQLLTLKWYFLEHVFGRYKSALFPGLCQSTLMNKHIAFSASISSNTRHKKSLQKVFLFPLVFMTLPNTLWFPSASMCKPSQRVSGLFQHERNTFLQKKKKISRTHDGIHILHWPVWKCERKLLRDTVSDRIHSRQMCKSKVRNTKHKCSENWLK